MSSIDDDPLYSQENKPRVEVLGRSVSLQVVPAGRSDGTFISLTVSNHELVELTQYRWNGQYRTSIPRIDQHEHDREVWEYLREWDYAQARQIGEEDWEWFATDKLIGVINGTANTADTRSA